MKIAIYARVSTEEQAKHGYSLEHQVAICKEQAQKDNKEEDIIFFEYIDNGFSGEFIERPFLSKLREDVYSNFVDKIYCYDPDRLSRTLMHQLILDEEFSKRSQLVFVNGEYEKTPEGKLFYQLRGAVAEFEKAKINERMTNGRKTKAKKGMVVKNNYIYGYDYDKEKAQLIINEEESKTVKFIFDSFTATNGQFKGINGIALYLTKSGVPTKKKRGRGIWHREVVRQILMNEIYTGKYSQNKYNTEGMLGNKFKTDNKVRMTIRPEEEWITVSCPIIIDKAQFDFAQKLIQTSKRRWSGQSRYQYLLSGLVRCNNCNNTMIGRHDKQWSKYLFIYSDKKSVAGAKHKGCGTQIKCEDLDNYIWEEISKIIDQYNNPIKDNNSKNLNSYEQEEKIRLTKLLNEKELNRKQFVKSLSQGKIVGLTQEEINEAIADSQKEIQEIKGLLIAIEKQLEFNNLNKGQNELTKEFLKQYSDMKELTFDQKKEVIRFFVREIRVDKSGKIDIFGL